MTEENLRENKRIFSLFSCRKNVKNKGEKSQEGGQLLHEQHGQLLC